MQEHYQIIIVGGGPVGIALAVELAQRNVSCAVVERHLEVGRIPKGQNLTQRTLEHFYFWNCVEQLRAARLLPPNYPIGGLTAYRSLASEYWYVPPGLEQVQSYHFQDNERLPQYLTEEVLRRRLTQLESATTKFGWTAKSIEQDDSEVRVTIAGEEWPYEEMEITSDYVVGCDGARSLVRQQLGIVREGPDFGERMALLVFRSRDLHEGLKRFPERTTYRVLRPELKGVWQFFGRVDVGETWFFHGPVPDTTTARDIEYLHDMLEEAAGFPIAVEFEHIGFWDLRVEVATTYRNARGFIAGDAAHSHPPYGGFGLNTGLEDIANLGWKLAARVQGWGGDALLDSYSEERQPVFKETGERVIAGGILNDREFLATYDPEANREAFEAQWRLRTSGDSAGPGYEPNYAGSTVVFGPEGARCGATGRYTFVAQAGHHLAPVLLSNGHNVYEELGDLFTLLAFDADAEAVQSFESAATRRNLSLKTVTDSFEGQRGELKSRLVLVRPDQFVVWAGDSLGPDPKEIFDRATGSG
ncbi:MAG TPA: FAD-dependent monooxygenase [Acidimicrobiales bacterium]|nr:FAD-dependent monooxygenase [Acidimicrobiales bacterium]